MDKNDLIGSLQILGGSYIGYKCLEHGLPRSLGIRIENHTTLNENALLIKQSGNILDPACGGKNGFAAFIPKKNYIENSKNYVHITGIKGNSEFAKFINKKFKNINILTSAYRTYSRNFTGEMYRLVGNGLQQYGKNLAPAVLNRILHNKTKRFYVPGIDSYFNANFVSDSDDWLAMKTDKKLKVYNNRFEAMLSGVKTFGLKGIRENKSRFIFGIGLLLTGAYAAINLVLKGIKHLNKT